MTKLAFIVLAFYFFVCVASQSAPAGERSRSSLALKRESSAEVSLPKEDPDVHRNLTEMISAAGYVVETHHAVTTDGYVLTMFRVPCSKPCNNVRRPVVFLQHGLIDCAFSWFANGPGASLAYVLVDAGYDVWTGNVRGNVYSTDNIYIKNTDKAFWKFTFDDHALVDLPTMVKYVQSTTGVHKIAYVGHSQGGMMINLLLSERPEFASNFNLIMQLAPAVTVAHQRSPLLTVGADLFLGDIVSLIAKGPFMMDNWIIHALSNELCRVTPILCENALFLLMGFNENAWNHSKTQVYLTHEPGGSSWMNMVHWSQIVRNKNIAKFDYGSAKNQEIYGSTSPPLYDITRYPKTIPTAVFAGGNDWLADPADITNLLSWLPHDNLKLYRYIEKYEHLDFLWASDAMEMVWSDVVKLSKTFNVL